MRKFSFSILLIASLLSACGGGDSTTPPPTAPPVAEVPPAKPRFGAQISFGDSLSDVGTYAVGTVKALGGGKFTINGDNTAIQPALTGKNWTEVMATTFALPAPCAAQTGLDGDATRGFSVPVENHAGCFGYAQGGARVSNPVGPNHKLTGSALGALTVPVAQQVRNHLAVSAGKFKADDIVLVMAGGNDLLFQLGALQAAATAAGTAAGNAAFDDALVSGLSANATDPAAAALSIRAAVAIERTREGHTTTTVAQVAVGTAAMAPGNSAVASPTVYGPIVAQAISSATTSGEEAAAAYTTAQGTALVTAMQTAGSELAALVNSQIVANGAQFVVVNNLPDVASTPAGRAQTAQGQALITAMAQAFNAQLSSGLTGEARVLLVDVYALTQTTTASPVAYGLTDVTTTACDLDTTKNPLGSSLVCNGANLKAGDVSHYAYADEVHPTPYYYGLLARQVAEKMTQRGWL